MISWEYTYMVLEDPDRLGFQSMLKRLKIDTLNSEIFWEMRTCGFLVRSDAHLQVYMYSAIYKHQNNSKTFTANSKLWMIGFHSKFYDLIHYDQKSYNLLWPFRVTWRSLLVTCHFQISCFIYQRSSRTSGEEKFQNCEVPVLDLSNYDQVIWLVKVVDDRVYVETVPGYLDWLMTSSQPTEAWCHVSRQGEEKAILFWTSAWSWSSNHFATRHRANTCLITLQQSVIIYVIWPSMYCLWVLS